MNEEKSLLNATAGKVLKDAIQNHPKTQIEIAESLDISTKQLQNYSKGVFPRYKSDMIQKLDKYLGTNVYGLVYGGETKSEPEKENKVLNEGEAVRQKIEDVKNNDNATMQDIRDLIASNKILAEANKTLADAHFVIAENNKELLRLTKQPIIADTGLITDRLTAVEQGLSAAGRNQVSMYAFQMAFQETVFDLLKVQQSKKKEFGEKVISFLEKFRQEGIPTS